MFKYEKCKHFRGTTGCTNTECLRQRKTCCFTCILKMNCGDYCAAPDIKENVCPGPPPEYSNSTSGAAVDQKHYQVCDPQPIEIMQMYLTPEEFRGFLKGCVIKYSLRAKFKGDEQRDIDKAQQYAKWLGQALRGEKIDPRAEEKQA